MDSFTRFINLWRNPTSVLEALSIANGILLAVPARVDDGHGVEVVLTRGQTAGEVVSVPWSKIQNGQWHPCNFAQTELVRTAYYLREGQLYISPKGIVGDIPLAHLGSLGELGPDTRDIHDGFETSLNATSFPALWSHDAKHVLTMAMKPNAYLRPLNKAKAGRPLRRVELLWPRAGRVMLVERMRLNSQKLVAIKLPHACLSNSWWPFRLNNPDPILEKALVLWMNSTLGLMIQLSHRVTTQGAWVKFKKPLYETMPVLDIWRLTEAQLMSMAVAFDELSVEALQSLGQMADDPIRIKIDKIISRTLGLPSLDSLRTALAREPVISLQRVSSSCGQNDAQHVGQEFWDSGSSHEV